MASWIICHLFSMGHTSSKKIGLVAAKTCEYFRGVQDIPFARDIPLAQGIPLVHARAEMTEVATSD